MAVFKCKMCGGTLDITEGMTVCECEYCGSTQTVPQLDDEKKINLFTRANRLRLACEFDKAFGVYESLVSEFSEEAEAYWGLILCKYGIEYVDDPATGKKIPTCHRSSFDSVMDDPNFEMVMEYSDAVSRRVYHDEAKQIEELRKGIIEVSTKEEPYDIFICYKETDENGNRTIDSVIAQDVYNALTEMGYKVFFSRITLEDKLGQEYEPYIFAALNSAKVMLAFGTDYEYYNAVWVKNEWSRFLALIAKGEKKTLIPCYKNIDAYDMPKEFARLQAQDMGKVGAMQDLLRGIGKIIGTKAHSTSLHTSYANNEAETMKQRGYMALEDGEIEEAKRFFERALDINPSDARAYLGKFLAQYGFVSLADFDKKVIYQPENNKLFKRAEQFADPTLMKELNSFKESNSIKVERLRLLDSLKRATHRVQTANNKNYLAPIRDIFNQYRVLVAAGSYHTVGLKSDGTVIATKYIGDQSSNYGQCYVIEWSDIVAVTAGSFHTVGLKSDGTVVAVGSNYSDRCNVSGWNNITAVSAGTFHTVGLKSDRTVIAVGKNKQGQCNVSEWTNIVAIAAGDEHTVGLKSDGTVIAVGNNEHGQCNVSGWVDVVAVVAGSDHTVGLKADGKVVATRYIGDLSFNYGQCQVLGWSDIVAVMAGPSHTVGLKSDGTAVAVGSNLNGEINVSEWSDIVAIAAGSYHTVGLKSDGTVVATRISGIINHGQCDVSNWKLFKSETEKETEYINACVLQESGEEESLAKAYEIFCGLKNYKDSIERAEACNREYETKKAIRAEHERKESERRRAEEAELKELERKEKIFRLNEQKTLLQNELANLRGLFSHKRRKEIKENLIWIENELKKI